MAKDKKRKHFGRTLTGRAIFIRILAGLIVVFAVASGFAIYFEQENQLKRIEERNRELQKQLDQAYIEQGELKELYEMVDTDAYIERVAREQLGMVKPDEIVFEDN